MRPTTKAPRTPDAHAPHTGGVQREQATPLDFEGLATLGATSHTWGARPLWHPPSSMRGAPRRRTPRVGDPNVPPLSPSKGGGPAATGPPGLAARYVPLALTLPRGGRRLSWRPPGWRPECALFSWATLRCLLPQGSAGAAGRERECLEEALPPALHGAGGHGLPWDFDIHGYIDCHGYINCHEHIDRHAHIDGQELSVHELLLSTLSHPSTLSHCVPPILTCARLSGPGPTPLARWSRDSSALSERECISMRYAGAGQTPAGRSRYLAYCFLIPAHGP